MELEKNPSHPTPPQHTHLSVPPPHICVGLPPGPAHSPHHWDMSPQWRGKSYLVPWLQAAGLIPLIAVGARCPHWAVEEHIVTSSPKPQAVLASVKCDLSWAPVGPSKQAIFMK